MADKKISQLTAASTPLAGTEVLPIVQSGSTVKVSSDDLTVKNVRSNATTGILQVAGPDAGTTRTMTVPNANFTAARTDAAQTFTGTQTFSSDATFNTVRVGLGAGSVADNVVLGTDVSPFITSGPRNVSIGWRGGFNLTSGSDNVSVGTSANYGLSTGTQNTVVGSGAAEAITTSSENTAVGYRSLYVVAAGAQNTAVGAQSLAATTGTGNTGLGYLSGSAITTGSKNVVIGAYTGSAAPISATGSNNIVFSDGDANVRGHFDSSGNLNVTNGNVKISTAAKGIDFSANTGAAGETGALLNWYEEGTWTPTDASGATLTFAQASGSYTRIGRQVTAWGFVTYPATVDASGVEIGGLPFTSANVDAVRGGGMIGFCDASSVSSVLVNKNGTAVRLYDSSGVQIANSTMNNKSIYYAVTYFV